MQKYQPLETKTWHIIPVSISKIIQFKWLVFRNKILVDTKKDHQEKKNHVFKVCNRLDNESRYFLGFNNIFLWETPIITFTNKNPRLFKGQHLSEMQLLNQESEELETFESSH